MKVPLSWLREYAPTDLDARELAVRLAMTGTEVERVTTHGVSALENFVVGRVLTAEQHPDADRLKVCTVDVGDGEPKQIVCGAPNVAAGQTVGVARPGSVMPDGTRLKAAKLRGVVSDGMILAEDEVGIGTDHAGTMVLDDTLEIGSPLADAIPIADDVLELEITPNRPDCLGIYGVAREVHAATASTLTPPPWAQDPHPAGDDIDGVTIDVRCPDLCPRFTARVFDERHDRPVAALAQGPAYGGRSAPDLQRRRHHQLRDAADRPAAARVRPRSRRGSDARHPPRQRRRAGRDARRPDAHAHPERHRHRRRPGTDVDRRCHGRRALRGLRRHDPRPDGGRDVGRPDDQPHLDPAGPAQRGKRALREGPGTRAVPRCPGGRRQADGRPVRRDGGPGHDRRRRRWSGGCGHPAARAPRRGAARRPDRLRAPALVPDRPGLRHRPRATTASTSPSPTGGAATSRARPT